MCLCLGGRLTGSCGARKVLESTAKSKLAHLPRSDTCVIDMVYSERMGYTGVARLPLVLINTEYTACLTAFLVISVGPDLNWHDAGCFA
jgi:hypothetical protein